MLYCIWTFTTIEKGAYNCFVSIRFVEHHELSMKRRKINDCKENLNESENIRDDKFT